MYKDAPTKKWTFKVSELTITLLCYVAIVLISEKF